MKSGTPMARGFAFFPAPHGRGYLAAAVIFAVIALDQLLKFWVKTSFYLGEDLEILPFFHLRFIQNNGMAFGIELGSKLFLTGFRIVLVAFLLWYLCRIVKSLRMPLGYIVAVSLVTAGAFGNIVDCVLYGEIFTNPYPPNARRITKDGEHSNPVYSEFHRILWCGPYKKEPKTAPFCVLLVCGRNVLENRCFRYFCGMMKIC